MQSSVSSLPASYRLGAIEFEKDDDSNFHMDLIAGLANMRARNYSLQEVDKLQAKLIAGGETAAGSSRPAACWDLRGTNCCSCCQQHAFRTRLLHTSSALAACP